MILVLMGVCGCGKSTVGIHLAEKLKWSFADADEFHSEQNRQKMSQGQPLTDEDRFPWLLSIHEYMTRIGQQHQSGIVTCSALKKSYRDILRFGSESTALLNSEPVTGNAVNLSNMSKQGKEMLGNLCETDNIDNISKTRRYTEVKQEDGLDIIFIHLTGSKDILQKRMETRQGHFMPITLLESQLQTLEPLTEREPGIEIDVGKSETAIAKEIAEKLNLNLSGLVMKQ